MLRLWIIAIIRPRILDDPKAGPAAGVQAAPKRLKDLRTFRARSLVLERTCERFDSLTRSSQLELGDGRMEKYE